jgi:cellobiose-specific phosphotransferase system component IIB
VLDKLEKAFTAMKMEVRVQARSTSELSDFVGDSDIVLLSPQVAYMSQDIEEICQSHHVSFLEIPSEMFGKMDGAGIRDLVLKILNMS